MPNDLDDDVPLLPYNPALNLDGSPKERTEEELVDLTSEPASSQLLNGDDLAALAAAAEQEARVGGEYHLPLQPLKPTIVPLPKPSMDFSSLLQDLNNLHSKLKSVAAPAPSAPSASEVFPAPAAPPHIGGGCPPKSESDAGCSPS